MPQTYDYHRPGDTAEACRLLAELRDTQVLAGGTDLLFDLEAGLRQARHVVSLKQIEELKQIHDQKDRISIGAACTAREVQSSPLVGQFFPEITEMVVTFASPQIRARATVAGNICSAVPCGDFPVILIALGAQVELSSTRGTRGVTLAEFFTGPRETVRQQDELLTRILVPKRPPGSAACHLKFQRRASNSLAVASAGAFLRLENGTCREARVVLGAVAPVPLLAERAGAAMTGQAPSPEAIGQAARIARDEARPISDVRATEGFRRELVCVLTRRALTRVVEKLERPS